jgi:hypothetical protein
MVQVRGSLSENTLRLQNIYRLPTIEWRPKNGSGILLTASIILKAVDLAGAYLPFLVKPDH